MKFTVKIHKKGKVLEKHVDKGLNLLRFLQKNSIAVNASCDGNGTCGKCKVKVDGLSEEASNKEMKMLGSKALEKGYRLACYNKIASDINIYIDSDEKAANIITDIKKKTIKLKPVITKKHYVLTPPDIDDQRSDIERVLSLHKKTGLPDSIGFMAKLPDVLRQENFDVTLIYNEKKLIGIEPGDSTQMLFGIAVDIGTTTIAAYLINLNTGEKVDVHSLLNPQSKFGADVISRIQHTSASEEGLIDMSKLLVDSINMVIEQFAARNNINNTDIYNITFVGNTTMLHFLMKLSTKNMSVSPFIPVTTHMHKLNAGELGININPCGLALILPSVSAYIGADTVAAIISSGMLEKDKMSLLIDIGTNGEIVLGNNKQLFACSTAAGPAFEGAHLRNGVGGIAGAIDYLSLNPFKISTIGNDKAIGICGSGIVDAIAEMLTVGVLDRTGKLITSEEEKGIAEELKGKLVNIEGSNSFLILKSEECDVSNDIAITQKDIRVLQNAKAAIAAGIKILVKQAGVKLKDINTVYLAGGFGNFINTESALKIGLIPEELRGRLESVGNAAAAGAIEVLLSVDKLKEAEKIKERIKYIELSASQDFMDVYIENMGF